MNLEASEVADPRSSQGGIAGVWLLAAAAVLLRIAIWHALDPETPISDMRGYVRLATRLSTGQPYGDTFVSPGYPFALATAMRFLGSGMSAASVLHALLGGISVLAVYVAGRELIGHRLALMAAAVAAFDPTSVLYSTMLLSESLALALIATAVACLVLRSLRGGPVLAGALLGLGALTRESVVVLIPLLGIALGRERGWRAGMSLVIAGFLVILPWTARNAAVTGRPILIASSTGYNLLVGNNPYADGSQRGGKRIFAVPDPPVPESLPAPERHWRGTAYAASWAVAHPGHFLRKGSMGALRMLGLDRQVLYSLREGYYSAPLGRAAKILISMASVGAWVLMFPLAVLGLFLAPQRLRMLGKCTFLWLLILGVVAFGEWRFRVPMLPIFALLAVAGANAWLAGQVPKAKWLAAGGLIAPVLILWAGELLSRAADL